MFQEARIVETYTNQGSDFIRHCLIEALWQLMKEKPYEEIEAKEICGKAVVGRTTYYRYCGSREGKITLIQQEIDSDYLSFVKAHESEVPPDHVKQDWLLPHFYFAEKEEIQILCSLHLESAVYRLIERLYGPTEKEEDGEFYLKYIGVGWQKGIFDAIVKKGFCESPEEIERKAVSALIANWLQKQKSIEASQKPSSDK